MNYEIRNGKEEDMPALQKFFSRVYGSSHTLNRQDYLSWQYKDVPANHFYPDYSNLLFFKDGEVAGHLGLIPYKFNIKGQEMRAAFLTSLIVFPELRGLGAGIFLAKEAEKYYDLLYTIGFNNNAAPVWRACQWSEERVMERWIVRKNELAALKIGNSEAFPISGFDEAWDEAWSKVKKYYPSSIDRATDYLNWRFINNPFIKYRIFVSGHSGLSGGYIVLREEEGEEYRACRIIDLIAAPEVRGALISKALDYAKTSGADFIDFFCSLDIYKDELERNGFKLYDPEENPEPPIFIMPPDRNRLKIRFACKAINKNILPFSPDDLFIVKSDGDKDRPQ